MKITVAGGGNIGLALVGEISRLRGYEVTLLTSCAVDCASTLRVEDSERDMVFSSGPYRAVSDPESALSDADLVICTYPAFVRADFALLAEKYMRSGTAIGFFPAYGGAEFYCGALLDRGVTIFGLQKVPYVARTADPGKTAGIWSRKKELLLAAIPASEGSRIAEIIEDMLLIPCRVLPNYMAATLLPGNPLLHTCGSYVFLKDYQEGKLFPGPIYYYRKWDDECSTVICALSDELQEVCRKLPVDLSDVQSIQDYYDSPTPELLTEKFHAIPSFRDLLLPMTRTEEGYAPDFTSRFFTEDMPFGVAMIKALAQLANVETPTADLLLEWYEGMTGKQYFATDGSFGRDVGETAIPQRFGIDTAERLR